MGIMDLADEQLAVGVAKVRKECTWPPTIAEFREACLGDDKHWMYKTIEANKHLKRLPVKKASDEVYQAEREKLRGLGIRI